LFYLCENIRSYTQRLELDQWLRAAVRGSATGSSGSDRGPEGGI